MNNFINNIAYLVRIFETFDEPVTVTDKGIRESGSHDELMAKKGAYYELYTSQSA